MPKRRTAAFAAVRPLRPARLPEPVHALSHALGSGGARGSERLRIAQITEYYYPHLGGVCEHVHFFGREARRLGHHVDIITSRMTGAPAMPHVIRIGQSLPVYGNGSVARITVGLRLRQQMRQLLRGGGYDIVHVHSPLVPTLPLLAIEEAEGAVVGTFHTYFGRSMAYERAAPYFQRRLDRIDAVVAVSPAARDAHAQYFDASWSIIPNGIDTDLFHPHAPPPPSWDREMPAILFVGRLEPRNGLGTLIDAYKRLRRRGGEARLVVVGDGPLMSHYRRAAGDHPGIEFVGAVLDGRAGYYANSAVYACPTTKASFGITLLESMACATPIVCSDIRGFRDVVAHGREALLVPCGDAEALAGALARLLDDDALRARLGAAGRERALAYGWRHVTRDVLGLYGRLLDRAAVA